MTHPRLLRALRFLAAVLLGAPALYLIARFIRFCYVRASYPADIEWLEGPYLYQAYRVMRGLPTFGPPHQGYLPLFHPPLAEALVAIFGRIFGLDYTVGRAVSIGAFTLGCFLVALSLRRSATTPVDRVLPALFACACTITAVPLVAGVFDLSRDDSLGVALTVLAAVIADAPHPKLRGRRTLLLAAMITAAVYARATTLFGVAGVGLFVLVRHPKSGIQVGLWAIAFATVALVYLQFTSHGWYWLYTVSLLQNHAVQRNRFFEGLRYLHAFAPFAVALVPIGAALAAKQKLTARTSLWLLLAATALPSTLLPFAKRGGFYNDFVPYAFLIGPGAAFLFLDVLGALKRFPKRETVVRWSGYAAASLALLLRARAPWVGLDNHYLEPTEKDFAAARAFNAEIAKLEGGVLAPRAPFLPVLNGVDRGQMSDMPYMDLAWARFPITPLSAYFDRVGARWAIVSGNEIPVSAAAIAEGYQLERPITSAATLVGDGVTMRFLLRRIDDGPNGYKVFDLDQPLTGWKRTGDAFDSSPTPPTPVWPQATPGTPSGRILSSFHKTLLDPAVGTIVSPPFLLDRPHMGVRVGGSNHGRVRAELRVDGRTQRVASPLYPDSETMIRIVWDVAALAGKSAELAVVDDDSGPGGHITCSDIVLF